MGAQFKPMTEYEKILAISDNETVQLASGFKDFLHKKLCLGMTRYVCRNGTLSDGHEKITPASRYFQAIKEMYNLSNNIRGQRALAMEAQADLLDAREALELAQKESDKLRAQAKILMAQDRILTALVTVEDQSRQIDEFNKVRAELEPEVEAKYPEGIEQAEPDNWKAVAKYRSILRQMGQNVNLTHVPLDQETKAQVGYENGAPDLAVWMLVDKDEEIKRNFEGSFEKYMQFKFETKPMEALTNG